MHGIILNFLASSCSYRFILDWFLHSGFMISLALWLLANTISRCSRCLEQMVARHCRAVSNVVLLHLYLLIYLWEQMFELKCHFFFIPGTKASKCHILKVWIHRKNWRMQGLADNLNLVFFSFRND